MNAKVFINGRFFDEDRARISVFDRSFLYGDAAFETMRGYAGVIFRLDAHIARLLDTLKALKIKHAYTKVHLKEIIYKALHRNKLKSAYVRLVVTRGEGRFGVGHRDAFTPNIVVVAKDFEGYPDRMLSEGVSAKVIGVANEYCALSGMKTANYLNFILARLDAQGLGFDEAILTNTKGDITEGATSNIFLVKDGALITPSLDSGVLPGVTRDVIIDIAKKIRVPVKERAVPRHGLSAAEEVFLTNSLAEVLPVTKVDSKKVGDGQVGQLTKLLHISYQKQVIREVV